jgi:hypothetical protein
MIYCIMKWVKKGAKKWGEKGANRREKNGAKKRREAPKEGAKIR